MTATRAKKTVWEGTKALRRFLVPIESLEPFPGNPRRGNIPAIRESLREFGQRKPIVVEGSRIVAGHQLVTAATEEGWTHVAAMPNEFDSEDHARRFLLMDNRSSELGTIDDEALAVQLAALRDNYTGTGYTKADRDALEEQLARLRDAFQPTDQPPPALDSRSGTSGFFEVPLLLGPDDRKDFAQLVKMHQREWEITDVTAVVLRALRESGARL